MLPYKLFDQNQVFVCENSFISYAILTKMCMEYYLRFNIIKTEGLALYLLEFQMSPFDC